MKEHRYRTSLKWTGNLGAGTSQYNAYSRNHELSGVEKSISIPGSSDGHFRGDAARYNPEELLVASLSSCHMLWYLHLCATNGITVLTYEDDATGAMLEDAAGAGEFIGVILRPRVSVSPDSDAEKAMHLHHEAHAMCFIARSVRFPVRHEPAIVTAG